MPESTKPPESSPPTSRATLGLTGLTVNAMALIAPGAFLWLTFQIQALYGAPMAGSAMWFGLRAKVAVTGVLVLIQAKAWSQSLAGTVPGHSM